MKLIKYKYSGKKKEEEDQTTSCKICQDGEKFRNDLHFKYDVFGPYNSEPMCEVCATKYIFPNYDFSKHLEEGTRMNDGWVKSKPFKTAEGLFTVDYNRSLNKANVIHKGITYEGTLSEIVDFVAQEGINFEKKKITIPIPLPPISVPKPPVLEMPKPPIEIPVPPPPQMEIPVPPSPQIPIPPPPEYGIVG